VEHPCPVYTCTDSRMHFYWEEQVHIFIFVGERGIGHMSSILAVQCFTDRPWSIFIKHLSYKTKKTKLSSCVCFIDCWKKIYIDLHRISSQPTIIFKFVMVSGFLVIQRWSLPLTSIFFNEVFYEYDLKSAHMPNTVELHIQSSSHTWMSISAIMAFQILLIT